MIVCRGMMPYYVRITIDIRKADIERSKMLENANEWWSMIADICDNVNRPMLDTDICDINTRVMMKSILQLRK